MIHARLGTDRDMPRLLIVLCLSLFAFGFAKPLESADSNLNLITSSPAETRAKTKATTAPPNFVFVIADDLTYRDIGCYGGQAHTPNIDRLATEGMMFTRCFQAAPMCSPTRHNIYTGLYPVKSGAYPNHTFAKAGTKSIVQHLKPLGYRVALSGKTHIGPREIFSFEYSGKKNPDMKVIDTLFGESKKTSKPFCLIACSNEPHTPWNKGDPSRYPPDDLKLPSYIVDTEVVRENFSRYLAEITYYDYQVGQIDELLNKHGLRENTMLVVVSEQGNAFPFAKWTCYGNGLQSAMIVRWPGRVKPNSVSGALVEYVDVLPTFLDAAGAAKDSQLDGLSFLPVLRGHASRHKDHVYGIMTTRGIINGSSVYPIRTVRDERFRLVWNPAHENKFTNACTKSKLFRSMVEKADGGDARAKELVRRYHFRPEYELFDCDADPLEQVNLAGSSKHQATLETLKKKLREWMTAQGDQGISTEEESIFRLKKNAKRSRADALKRWKRRN
ncbi:MAG: sulfatase [Planctomycetota bacterium]